MPRRAYGPGQLDAARREVRGGSPSFRAGRGPRLSPGRCQRVRCATRRRCRATVVCDCSLECEADVLFGLAAAPGRTQRPEARQGGGPQGHGVSSGKCYWRAPWECTGCSPREAVYPAEWTDTPFHHIPAMAGAVGLGCRLCLGTARRHIAIPAVPTLLGREAGRGPIPQGSVTTAPPLWLEPDDHFVPGPWSSVRDGWSPKWCQCSMMTFGLQLSWRPGPRAT